MLQKSCKSTLPNSSLSVFSTCHAPSIENAPECTMREK
uniref:Uncharacterized protein n=1 Tax=Rhizophora mucronata TaxID=61149 RepID=A0A2P2NLC3_RHIMU